MNARHRFNLAKAAAGMGLLALAGASHAGVYWSVGVNAPVVGAVMSNAPVYYAPAPTYYVAPPPMVVQRPIIVQQPVYGVAPVMYMTGPRWEPPRRDWDEPRFRHHYGHGHWDHRHR